MGTFNAFCTYLIDNNQRIYVYNFVSVEAVRTSYRITSQMSQTSDKLSDILRGCSKGSWEAKQTDDVSVEYI